MQGDYADLVSSSVVPQPIRQLSAVVEKSSMVPLRCKTGIVPVYHNSDVGEVIGERLWPHEVGWCVCPRMLGVSVQAVDKYQAAAREQGARGH